MALDRTLGAVGLAGIGIAILCSGLGLPRSIQAQRRLYWVLTFTSSLLAGFAAAQPDWGRAFILTTALIAAMALWAYVWTPYVKIGGKIHALLSRNVDAERFCEERARSERRGSEATRANAGSRYRADVVDPYAQVSSAGKVWWIFTAVLAMCGATWWWYFAEGHGRPTALIATGLFLLAFSFVGYGEGSLRNPIASGRYLQFVLCTLVTAGVGMIFYVIGYAVGRKWPAPGGQQLRRAADEAEGR